MRYAIQAFIYVRVFEVFGDVVNHSVKGVCQELRSQSLGFDENSNFVQTMEFDYEEVDRRFGKDAHETDLADFSQDDIDRVLKLMEVLLKWVAQSGMKNPNGVQHRAVIVCWIFLKAMRPVTLTQLAKGYGLKKQSLGRWVDDFKRHFPRIRIPHMRSITNGHRCVRQWPAFLEAINRFSRFSGFVQRNPLTTWPADGIDQMRQDMLPIAAGLWPDKFK